jgi:hypothetical protein
MHTLPGASRTGRIALLAAVAIGADAGIDPARTHVPLCPFHTLTGLECPLCGSLRAVSAAARGHLAAALHDNVLLLLGGPALLMAWLALGPNRRERLGASSTARIAGLCCASAVLIAFTVLRNLPLAQALRPV